MHHKIIILSVLVSLTAIPLLNSDAFGHGLGADVAPPISFAGMQVTVSTIMSPSDITVGEVDRANLQVRFFDQNTDTNLESVTYRVEVFQAGELLAREYFYDKDGELNVQIRPKGGCFEPEPWRCTIYYGDREPISGGLQGRGTEVPVIQGPIFTKGGLYNIQVIIDGATSPKTLVAEPLEFDTFVSVAQEQFFSIPEVSAEIPVTIKTYYDDVSEFKFKGSDKSISFKMPFDWAPDYIDLVAVVHEEIRIPKSYKPYSSEKDFVGYVDGVQVDNRALLVDPYSSETENIIHFLVTGNELKRINEELGSEHYNKKEMFFELVPKGQTIENGFTVTFENGYKASVAWKRTYGAGTDIPFEITFFDANGELLKDVIGYVDGVQVDNRALLVDPYSSETENIIHFLVTGNELKRINEELGSEHYNKKEMFFELVPKGQTMENGFTVTFENGYKANVAWKRTYGAGTDIPFEITFFDANGELLKDVNYAILVSNPTGETIYQNLGDENNPYIGIKASEGIDTQEVYITSEGMHGMSLAITGTGISNWESYAIGETMFEIGKAGEASITAPVVTTQTSIPGWIKNNAGWWADGQIDDNAFVSGIQWLISNGIMTIPPTEQGAGSDDVIPGWIKNNAGWWADGQIDDNAFVSGLQWLISNGIMKIS